MEDLDVKWTLDQIAEWTGGKIISRRYEKFSEVGTDTRQDLKGKIFIALKGENYDAHDYLNKAHASGAKLLIIHRLDPRFESLTTQVSVLYVEDTLQALQVFAQKYRESLLTEIIAITGSNGKTTTKEFTATILNQYQPTHYSKGSFNNHWGVPLTLLATPPEAIYAVVEMGMNHAGEIAQLVKIAQPNYVVCTMVGTAHIEFFGTQQKIAEAKNEIYQESGELTVRVFNQDQELTFDMMYPSAKKFPEGRMLSFSQTNTQADVYFHLDSATQSGLKIHGSIAAFQGTAEVPVFGQHNIINLMAAATLCYAAGMEPQMIWDSLKLCQSSWGRNQFIKAKDDIDILFDGYNANPDSMKVLLENVKTLKTKGRKIIALGQMRELGEQSAKLHKELGLLVAQQNYDQVFFMGENFKDFEEGLKEANYKNYRVDADFTDKMESSFKNFVKPNDFVIIKGSRGIATERFVDLCSPKDWKNKY